MGGREEGGGARTTCLSPYTQGTLSSGELRGGREEVREGVGQGLPVCLSTLRARCLQVSEGREGGSEGGRK